MSIRPSFRFGIFVLTEPVEIQTQVSEEPASTLNFPFS